MSLPRWVLLVTLVLAMPAFAQTESLDPPDSPTPVIVTAKPATLFDAMDQNEGLQVKGLTLAGTMNDDTGGTLEVYAVTSTSSVGTLRGIALVVRRKDGQAARAYVDEDKIDNTLEAVKKLAVLDRGATPMQESRGIYRVGNIAVLNVDDNGGRYAIVRTLSVSPLTGQGTVAVARFRANRLNELARYLQAAKDALAKAPR